MITIQIQNSHPGDYALIQRLLNVHGFGVLSGTGGILEAVNPNTKLGAATVKVEDDLLLNVGKHLAISFSES
jgi:hypothetical protein